MPKYLHYTFKLALRQKKLVSILFFLLVLGVTARLIEPYLYKITVDTLTEGLLGGGFTEAAINLLIGVIVFWFVLAVILNITNAHASFIVWKIGSENSQTVHMAGYRRLLRLDYAEHVK